MSANDLGCVKNSQIQIARNGAAREARFRTVRMKAGVVPYGRVSYIHHFTRDLLWRDEWRHHANGVVAVVRAMIVDPDPAAGTGRREQEGDMEYHECHAATYLSARANFLKTATATTGRIRSKHS